MTELHQALDDYLRLRRSLGHQLAEARWLLPDFVAFMAERGEQTVTVGATLAWMKAREPGVVTTLSPRRITAVRGFARYLSGIDPATEVPPMGLVPYKRHRGQIFLYSDADIAAIMASARQTIPEPLRAATYHTLIGLLAASGLRIGEAIKLDRGDIDWTEGVLHIRESKFGESRLVPVTDSVMTALREYGTLRDELMPAPKDPAFFVSRTAKRLIYSSARRSGPWSMPPASASTHLTARGCTSSATLSPFGPCCTGTAPRTTCRRRSLPCRRIWATGSRPTPTGTSRRPRNCWHWPPHGARASGRRPAHDPDRPDTAGILHRPPRPAAPGQPRTIAAYRDTMRLLLTFVHQHTGKPPSMLDWDDLTAEVVSAFLNHLEDERGNSIRTRNVRLTAIRSLFSYAALQHPEHALLIARVLDIPPKRFDKRIVTFLTSEEVDALLVAPDTKRWEGRRDKTMMALAIQTGLRVSELTGLNCSDLTLGDGAAVRCEGKGRKQRTVPLNGPVQQLLRTWLGERAGGHLDPLFCTRTGRRLSRDAVAQRLATHVKAAARTCPSLLDKSIHPHVLRHSCAMSLLQAGVDTTVIALWLGHAGVRSTDAYVHADMTIKEKALALTTPATAKPGRYRPTDKILAFLESL